MLGRQAGLDTLARHGMSSAAAPIGERIRTADGGDPAAASALLAALYYELHGIA